MIQIELNENVWRLELDTPLPDSRWGRFIDLLQNEVLFYGVDEDGPEERFYITTAWDTSENEVYAIVERVLRRVLGIDKEQQGKCQTCNGEGVTQNPAPSTGVELCTDCIMQDKCPTCGAVMTFEEDGLGKCAAGHSLGG